MQKTGFDMRSKIAKAKGLGSAHHGVSHWWWQRVTALALVPLCLWFFYSLLTAMLTPEVIHVAEWLSLPTNALVTVLLLVALFAHAKLGVQVVIEDYIHSPIIKYTLLLLLSLACFALPAAGIIAVLKLHFLDITAVSM